MPRPRKRRMVCAMPNYNRFGPVDSLDVVTMSVEEYEAIRLIDNENLNQEEASNLMNVSRTTVQKIYDDARKKIADSIVNGKALKIEGGDYSLCTDSRLYRNCNRRNCKRLNSDI